MNVLQGLKRFWAEVTFLVNLKCHWMLFLHQFLTDPSVVQATGPVLPSTSVKTSGSDKQKHTKKSNSSKKSALPTTSPVDAESKISSDTQPVMPSPGTQSTQPTYAEVVKHLKIVLLPVLPVLLPIILVLLPVLPVLPVLLLKFHLYQPSPLLVYRIDQRVDRTNLTGMINLYLVWISQCLVKKGNYRNLKKSEKLVRTWTIGRQLGLYVLLWAGILFQILSWTMVAQRVPIIHGKARITRKPGKCQCKYQLMTGCVKK